MMHKVSLRLLLRKLSLQCWTHPPSLSTSAVRFLPAETIPWLNSEPRLNREDFRETMLTPTTSIRFSDMQADRLPVLGILMFLRFQRRESQSKHLAIYSSCDPLLPEIVKSQKLICAKEKGQKGNFKITKEVLRFLFSFLKQPYQKSFTYSQSCCLVRLFA